MSQKLRVEFKMAANNRRPAPKPKTDPVATAELRRQTRATRKARNQTLAHYIDGLVRSGEVADLAALARLCGVSRAHVSKVLSLLGTTAAEQERLIGLVISSRRPLNPPPHTHVTVVGETALVEYN